MAQKKSTGSRKPAGTQAGGRTAAEVIEEVKNAPGGRVKVAVSDIDGILRGKYIHKEKFLSAVEGGFGFCNVVFGWDSGDNLYDNCNFTGWQTGYPDAQARIDLNTFRRVPWDDDVPFFLGDFEADDGTPLPVCPRQVLKQVIKRAGEMGFIPVAGVEYEWFNFNETPNGFAQKGYANPQPISPGMFGYSLIRAGQQQPYFKALMEELAQFRVPIEGLHTETGPGVYEAAILYSEALEAADRAILFKTAAKEIGHRFGIMPSFMAKWNATLPGCSGHMHQSLQDAASGANLFYAQGDRHRMSELFKMYLAGQMHCLPEILPMYAPTVNSYKRLVDGYWAPTKPTWGVDNRTASFRVIPGSSKSTRLETRVAGADINPYLALAAAIASGLYGIAHKMKLKSSPIQGSGYLSEVERLPRNLLHSTENMAKSKIARELFGAPFVEHFVNTRLWEWRQFQDAVTDWEFKRYFEII